MGWLWIAALLAVNVLNISAYWSRRPAATRPHAPFVADPTASATPA
jgi:hypothetical protein